jgi:hypothetical protein
VINSCGHDTTAPELEEFQGLVNDNPAVQWNIVRRGQSFVENEAIEPSVHVVHTDGGEGNFAKPA